MAPERIPHRHALEIARVAVEALKPVTKRAKVAGSVRRRLAWVKDIEIVAEPLEDRDLMDNVTPAIEPILHVVRTWGEIVKRGERYIQVQRKDGRTIDLFLVHPPAEWGSILAIRTGPAELGHYAMIRFQRRGLAHREGGIVELATGRRVPVPDEETFFRLAGLPCVPPPARARVLQSVPPDQPVA